MVIELALVILIVIIVFTEFLKYTVPSLPQRIRGGCTCPSCLKKMNSGTPPVEAFDYMSSREYSKSPLGILTDTQKDKSHADILRTKQPAQKTKQPEQKAKISEDSLFRREFAPETSLRYW